jgi:hypothetical protein
MFELGLPARQFKGWRGENAQRGEEQEREA